MNESKNELWLLYQISSSPAFLFVSSLIYELNLMTTVK